MPPHLDDHLRRKPLKSFGATTKRCVSQDIHDEEGFRSPDALHHEKRSDALSHCMQSSTTSNQAHLRLITSSPGALKNCCVLGRSFSCGDSIFTGTATADLGAGSTFRPEGEHELALIAVHVTGKGMQRF